MLECPFCFQYFHPMCVGVPDPDAAEYAEVWACESCHKRPGMPPHPSTWYGVQECDRDPKTCKGDECETCAAYNANASPEAFREAVDGRRRYLPKTVEELKKAGATYKSKWFKLIQEEGYAASQSDHSSPTAMWHRCICTRRSAETDSPQEERGAFPSRAPRSRVLSKEKAREFGVTSQHACSRE